MKPWDRIEPSKVQKIGRRTIVTKHFKVTDGTERTFVTISREGQKSVAMVALTPDNKLIIARQYRVGPQKVMDELPGGGVEPGEETEAAALRELQEETGYIAGKVTYLGKIYKDAYNNCTWHYYFATDCVLSPDGQNLDPGEFVEPILMTIKQAIKAAKEAMMTDTEALFLAYDELLIRIAD